MCCAGLHGSACPTLSPIPHCTLQACNTDGLWSRVPSLRPGLQPEGTLFIMSPELFEVTAPASSDAQCSP